MSKPDWPSRPLIPVAWGEVFDKLSILAIKRERIDDPNRQSNIAGEQAALDQVVGDTSRYPAGLDALRHALKAVNAQLWDIENGKRAHEARQCFDDVFIQLSRSVYQLNDQRAKLKRQIDTLLGSELTEEKSHPAYDRLSTSNAMI